MSEYAKSGVNIDTKMALIDRIKGAVATTHNANVLAGVGSFGGLFRANGADWPDNAVLVASTDGVGTKTMLAAQTGNISSYRGLGHDIVNHSVNDILCQGARPLFFMDYIASSKLDTAIIAEIIGGIAEACQAAGCALLGGETAEMPGVYQSGHLDLVGTIVGVASQDNLLPQTDIQLGDIIFGLPSSGPHTNGYSLIRRVFADVPLDTQFDGIGLLGEAILAPHRSYLADIARIRSAVSIKALAHITGGGFYDNIPRVLPDGVGVEIDKSSWQVPALFKLIAERGDVADEEMYRVFNMGIGMIIIVGQDAATKLDALRIARIGRVVAGKGVRLT